jgi:NAD-dependent SIR2 family protein deacetylase
MDVYLLGAGFSSDAGVPTMKNFLKGVRQTEKDCGSLPVYQVLQRAIAYAEKSASENIEDLLVSAVNEPVFFDLIWAFGVTINYFSRKFLTHCQAGHDIGWYDKFAHIITNTDSHILTFNYDLILEEVLWWRTGCREDYVIPFNEVRHYPSLKGDGRAVPLYKLHGSVSWLWCLDCHFTVNRYRHVLPAAYDFTLCPRCSSRLIPLMVPPTFRKAKRLVQILDNLWQQADSLLGQAERLVVGGLSLADRDADVRERFLAGISRNTSLKEIVIVNRDLDNCQAIGRIIDPRIPRHYVAGFPEYCREN